MQNKRLIWFLIMIGIGLVAGLIYGWIINPVKYVEPSAETLRKDYKADYVLMVSEIYQKNGDVDEAVRLLALIDSQPAGRIAAGGLVSARELGFTPADLSLMETLAQSLQSSKPTSAQTDQP
jgi:hypothetical protein